MTRKLFSRPKTRTATYFMSPRLRATFITLIYLWVAIIIMEAILVAAYAQGWSYTPPAGSDTPLPAPAPLSASTSGAGGLYGGQVAASGQGMMPNTGALPNQPWQQQFGIPFGTQPYQTIPGLTGPAQPPTGALATLRKPTTAPNTAKKEDKPEEKKDKTPAAPPAIIVAGDKFRGQGRAVSGDTLSVNGQTLHLFGLRAPELGGTCQAGLVSWRCGDASRESLQNLLSQGDVDCIVVSSGSPPEATCRQAGEDISRAIVADGMATTDQAGLVGLMLDAKHDRRGLWTDPNSSPPLPGGHETASNNDWLR